jgi:hypothetical protein
VKFKLQVITTTIAVLASGFVAGYSYRGELNLEAAHAEFVDGQRDVTAYVEDCTLEAAHAERCMIPCSGDADCLAKNGTKSNY